MVDPRISLEQWRSLLAVVDAGGYAQAAEALHKSQSAVTYAVQKIEALLSVKLFEVIGRKAHLTPTGEVVIWVIRIELIEHQERIQVQPALATKAAAQLDAGAIGSRYRWDDLQQRACIHLKSPSRIPPRSRRWDSNSWCISLKRRASGG